jgi:hypothetical protein
MKLKPWAMMPTAWIQDGDLQKFQWKEGGSANTAALMIYFVMCQLAAERPLRASEKHEPGEHETPPLQTASRGLTYEEVLEDKNVPPWQSTGPSIANATLTLSPAAKIAVVPNVAFLRIGGEWGADAGANTLAAKADVIEHETPDSLVVRVTYDDLAALIGLSRDRVNAGLQKLLAVKMIWRVDKSSTYGLSGYGPGQRWAKLPGKALLSPAGTAFEPFSHFRLRSKTELNALKLHLYYASTRPKDALFSTVAYPMIHKRTGVSERDIPRANTLLVSSGILARTRGLPSEDARENAREHEANKYYLTGYDHFITKKKTA